jgi:hypothetical protein
MTKDLASQYLSELDKEESARKATVFQYLDDLAGLFSDFIKKESEINPQKKRN